MLQTIKNLWAKLKYNAHKVDEPFEPTQCPDGYVIREKHVPATEIPCWEYKKLKLLCTKGYYCPDPYRLKGCGINRVDPFIGAKEWC